MRFLYTLCFLALFCGCFASSGDEPLCTATPTCDPGTITVASCEGVAGCYQNSLCGVTISCAPPTSCGALPVCAPEEIEVSECYDLGTCREVSLCGESILCAEACSRSCPSGTYPVDECDDDFGCSSIEACGETQYCQRETGCMDPACPDGFEQVAICGDEVCITLEECGERIWCREALCEPEPICPPDTEPVEACGDSPDCITLTDCGLTYHCQGPTLCDVPCPGATSEVIASGPGACSSDALYCHQDLCPGDAAFCETACPQGAWQLDGPEDCEEQIGGASSCYFADHDGYGRAWCLGEGPICRAIPTCQPGDAEIAFHAPCDGRSCYYVTTCSTTIQCSNPGSIDG